MVTETFTNKNEIKNPSPHYNCLQPYMTLMIELVQICQKFDLKIRKEL